MREAWRRAREAHDAEHPALRLAVAAYARDGPARGVPIETLLRALDTVVRPADDGYPTLASDAIRAYAGSLLIRAYYRAD